MKKLLAVILLTLFTQYMQAQQLFEAQPDPKEDGTMLVGTINDSLLKKFNYPWYTAGLKAYKPDSNYLNGLSKSIKDYSFTVFAGTWCEDTHNLLPKFMSVINALKVNDAITIYGVDRGKKTLNMESELMDITNVPTIIIRKGPREIGRIIESLTKEKIEQELLFLIEKDKETWKH